MEPRLANKLAQKRTLKTLREGLLKRTKVFVYRSEDNVFYMLCQHDKTIGYSAGKKIYLSDMGWQSIINLVKAGTGVNLILDDIEVLSQKGRLENSTIMANEKILSRSPTQGFILCRLLGRAETLSQTTNHFANQSTPFQSYLGVHINHITNWEVDIILVIENFASFTEFTESHLSLIEGISDNGMVLLIYRGHDDKNIYSVATEIASLTCPKYVFADYDLAGLQIAEVIAERIESAGYILPKKAMHNQKLLEINKIAEREKQSATIIKDSVLQPYMNDMKDRFLAVTQEALMAHGVELEVVSRE
ncbi:DUF7281 domain-containing protein [Psychrobacter cryohalolentis]|uniref:DUF7281 domain-containing protein n=1 Tax=Psychrobacter cryohalolentis TaxID=330922 RepID=UPI003F867847